MSDPQLRWLRLWTDILSDPKVQSIAPDDRWQYVAILCMKRRGDLDTESSRRDRYVSVTLGVTFGQALDELRRRLCDAELIDKNWQPLGWDKRQYKSDQEDGTAADRMRRYRERKRNGRNGVTGALRPDQSQIRSESEITPNPSLPSVRGKGDFQNGGSHDRTQTNGSNGRESRLDARGIYRQLVSTGGAFMRGDRALEGALELIGGWSAIRERTPRDEKRLERTFCSEYRRLAGQ